MMAYYENWVVPAGVGSALADILGAEFRQIIDIIIERGGVYVIKSIFLFVAGSKGFESGSAPGSSSFHHHHPHHQHQPHL